MHKAAQLSSLICYVSFQKSLLPYAIHGYRHPGQAYENLKSLHGWFRMGFDKLRKERYCYQKLSWFSTYKMTRADPVRTPHYFISGKKVSPL